MAHALRFRRRPATPGRVERASHGDYTDVIKPRLLIAEDEVHLREILRFQLESAGFEVIDAGDGEEAVQRATEMVPDLILLDVMMPHVDGYEACRRLRASYVTRHVPIIMLTAKSTPADKVSGLGEGANDYLTKPWERDELVLRVRNALEWSRQQRAASPLTGLPGNHSINDELARRIDAGTPFALMQIDIDFFKAFNDRYGYPRGDEALQALAHILIELPREMGRPATFVGHIGGDDFVVIAETADAEAMGRKIIARFNALVPSLYDPADAAAQCVQVLNRRHQVERFPLMSLTIALVSTDRVPVTHLAQLTDIAQELKAHGKGISGSVLVGDRREQTGSEEEPGQSAA
jgi:diguanylate cyclase (GGDEF)-like protein